MTEVNGSSVLFDTELLRLAVEMSGGSTSDGSARPVVVLLVGVRTDMSSDRIEIGVDFDQEGVVHDLVIQNEGQPGSLIPVFSDIKNNILPKFTVDGRAEVLTDDFDYAGLVAAYVARKRGASHRESDRVRTIDEALELFTVLQILDPACNNSAFAADVHTRLIEAGLA